MLHEVKGKKGITGIDITIAIMILTIFTGVIIGLFYNIYLTSISIQRTDGAMHTAIELLEYINITPYDQVDNNLINTYLAEKGQAAIPKGYRDSTVTVQNYATTENGLEDVIKIVEVRIKYEVGKKEESFSIKTLKIKEL